MADRARTRILFKLPLKTVADRRVRRALPTVPPADAEFSELERGVFADLERRNRPKSAS